MLIDLISLSLAASFSFNSLHGSYTVHIGTLPHQDHLGDDDEPQRNQTQAYRHRYPCKILYPYCILRLCQALNC